MRHAQNVSNQIFSKKYEITVATMDYSKLVSLGNCMIFLRLEIITKI